MRQRGGQLAANGQALDLQQRHLAGLQLGRALGDTLLQVGSVLLDLLLQPSLLGDVVNSDHDPIDLAFRAQKGRSVHREEHPLLALRSALQFHLLA